MKRFLIATVLTLTANSAWAQAPEQSDYEDYVDTIVSVPISPNFGPETGVDPATFDITGVWDFATSDHNVAGISQSPGTPMKGRLEITQNGDEIALQLVSGAVCSPASMCSFTGAIEDGALIVSNTDTVDSEGGTVTNAMVIYFFTETDGIGHGGSLYHHPEGEAQWAYAIQMNRPQPLATE